MPGLRVREFDTAGEVKPGQALVVVGPVEQRVAAVCREVAEGTEVSPFIEELVEQFAGCFEDHPAVGMATCFALNSLGWTSSHQDVIQEEEEIQFVAVIRSEVAENNAAQPALNARNFGCDLGCCESNACAGQCAAATCEALRQPLTGSFAVQPAACWGSSSANSALFEHVLVDTPVLLGPVQPAYFTTPQLSTTKPQFDFDFQLPVLLPLDLTLPERSQTR